MIPFTMLLEIHLGATSNHINAVVPKREPKISAMDLLEIKKNEM